MEKIRSVAINTTKKTLEIKKKDGKVNKLTAATDNQWNRLKLIFKILAG